MSTYVPDAVQAGLDNARIKRMKTASKLRIQTADGYFRVLRLWNDGFSVAAEDAPHLRGYVDLYEGPSQLFQCLIVASREQDGEMQYDFKRITAVATAPALDFATEVETPVALIDKANLTA